MLQQTQVERVLPYWTAWMECWPTVSSLAAASPADVLRAWSGLGYNRRAVALQRAAVAVATAGGRIPNRVSELQSLPGIGPYTASAVACFAYGRRVAVVDTNIARVLARLVVGLGTAKSAGILTITTAAQSILPARGTRGHNLALMDLGATVCIARAPHCGECPIQRHCAWFRAGRPESITGSRAPSPPFESTARFARGRIVEALRRTPAATTNQLMQVLPEAHGSRMGSYLEALARDGLIESVADAWRLPLFTLLRAPVPGPRLVE